MRSPRATTKSSPHSPQLEKTPVQQRRPNAAQKKKSLKGEGRGRRGEGSRSGGRQHASTHHQMLWELLGIYPKDGARQLFNYS